MEIVAALAGSPLPTSIAVLIGIAAILGYYFFVIPLMESHKKLKAEHQELQEKFNAKREEEDGRFALQLGEVESAIHTLRESLLEGSAENGEKLLKVEQFVADISKTHSTFGTESSSLRVQHEAFSKELHELSSSLKEYMAGAKARDDSLDRLLSEVSRNMSSVNEKQSQILGALLGMGRIQDRNRGI